MVSCEREGEFSPATALGRQESELDVSFKRFAYECAVIIFHLLPIFVRIIIIIILCLSKSGYFDCVSMGGTCFEL